MTSVCEGRFKMKYVGWLCFTSHRQRGHLETAPLFIVPSKGREARLLHCFHRESNPRPSCGSLLHYRCTTEASQYGTLIYFNEINVLTISGSLKLPGPATAEKFVLSSP